LSQEKIGCLRKDKQDIRRSLHFTLLVSHAYTYSVVFCVNFALKHKLPLILHGKNSFAEVSKKLARYRSENNFVCRHKEVQSYVRSSDC